VHPAIVGCGSEMKSANSTCGMSYRCKECTSKKAAADPKAAPKDVAAVTEPVSKKKKENEKASNKATAALKAAAPKAAAAVTEKVSFCFLFVSSLFLCYIIHHHFVGGGRGKARGGRGTGFFCFLQQRGGIFSFYFLFVSSLYFFFLFL
jgi:hypothetical protein